MATLVPAYLVLLLSVSGTYAYSEFIEFFCIAPFKVLFAMRFKEYRTRSNKDNLLYAPEL